MFRIIANDVPGGPTKLFEYHPATLAAILEAAWKYRMHGQEDKPFGHVARPSPALPDALLKRFAFVDASSAVDKTVRWHHLIYAYMIENTRIFEIFDDRASALASFT